LDLPAAARQQLTEPLKGGMEWGKAFGWLLGARRVLERADAVLTCNGTEARLLKHQFPDKIVLRQPHGVVTRCYREDHRATAAQAFPQIAGKQVLLVVGRIDPVKNQTWIVGQLPRALEQHPGLHLILAGACTDEAYGKSIKKEIRNLALEPFVTLTGGLPANSEQLIGLFQSAAAVVLPSLSETFGLVIVEAWAAGAPVLASRTSGALDLIRDGEDGWLFDTAEPAMFHTRLDDVLRSPDRARELGQTGQRRVETEFDCALLTRRVKDLYEELMRE
jgi:glycosyltransferase involved in cell wall biosynthesis